MAEPRMATTAEAAFARHAERAAGDACWRWNGYHNVKGYGFTRYGGRGAPGLLAHRLAWTVLRGPIPDGKHVLHRCDNPGCVNPDHLFVGTNQDNIADRIAKGRKGGGFYGAGERHPNATLDDRQVREIARRRRGGERAKDLAVAFNISRGHVSRICHQRVRRSAW